MTLADTALLIASSALRPVRGVVPRRRSSVSAAAAVLLFAAALALLPSPAAAAGPYGSVRLLDPHPRVAAPATFVPFYLDRGTHVVLDVLDADGVRVVRLADRTFTAGRHAVRWRGTDAEGRLLAPGLYTVRLSAGGAVRTLALPLVD